ncbi:MAG: hypothetical protein E7183_02485 [Erysipelotrichaceae bacterium]|nr:hypothetical protein [Erysipelotrichaceae bacterium]
MKKILFLILLLGLLFITSCDTTPTESYITNIEENNYIVTWDKDEDATLYYIQITHSVTTSTITFTTEDNSYDLNKYITDLEKKYNGFTLTIQVKSNSINSIYKNSCIIEVEEKIVELLPAPIPTNLLIDGTILSWDVVDNISNYQIELTFNNFTETIYSETNSFDFSEYLIDSGVYSFKVKAIKSDSYSVDSDYSESIEYIYENIQIEKEIFNYDFTKMDNLVSGGSITKFEKYADKSLKFSSSGFYFTTPTFTAYKSFSVTATIKGNNCSGTGLITIYGLDSSNKVVEKQEYKYPIENTKHELKAEFSNTNIVKIKFEYTTKDKGNVGLYSLVCNHDEESDKITQIELINYQDTYVIGSSFDYNGSLLLTYKSGKKEEIAINKDLITISNFTTTTKGTYTGTIKYQSVTGTFIYNVIYDYEAIYEYAESINIYTIDLSDELNNLFTILNIKNNDKEINILFDYNKSITLDTYNLLKNELSKYIDSALTYYYSVNNQNIFNQNKLTYLDKNEYNFAADLDLFINPEYYEINIYGYSYYFAANNLSTDHKVDILQLNGDITTDELKSLDPEQIILQEGTINNFINNGILIYQTDNEIYQYSPTINESFYYTFDLYGYNIEGNTTELSSTTIWSDSETLGLHHNTQDNYLYRKSYYGNIKDLYGQELINALRKVITETHTYSPSYGDAKTMLAITDKDPLKPGFIIMTYTGDSIKSTWDQGITWNREHIWPKSLSGGLYTTISDSTRNAGSDLHHIRPALTAINSSRGNKMYGSTTNELTYYPGDEFAGDTARILFYLSIRYDMSITGLKVCEDINLLLSWNNNDKVDNLERNRNNAVQSIQGNYNPFIDNPWLADRIWK